MTEIKHCNFSANKIFVSTSFIGEIKPLIALTESQRLGGVRTWSLKRLN